MNILSWVVQALLSLASDPAIQAFLQRTGEQAIIWVLEYLKTLHPGAPLPAVSQFVAELKAAKGI